jgi:glycerol-3-phosphate O-acyltransferase
VTQTIALPLWLLVLVGLLAAWSLLERLLVPSVRWFFRRRVNRAIREVNTRLHIRIQPFKLTKREVLIDRLTFDPEVMAAMEAHVAEQGMPREVALARVRRYAREIVPAFNAYLYFRLGYWISRRVARVLYRVRLGYADEAALAAIPPAAAVVFVINHRSNMDYVLVSYLAAERTALSYAVGEWARVWPLQQLIRAMGAYFVRRNSGDSLYRRVLERYVQMATEAGVTQAVFPEGKLSRDGRLGAARLGLLDYMLRGFDPAGERDLVFVPVAVNYDRVLEDRTLLLELAPAEERRPAPALATTLRFAGRNLGLALRNRWHRFGYACVNFGAPLSLRGYLAARGLDLRTLERDERFARVAELAAELMAAVGRVVPVVPVPLVAAVFTGAGPGEALSELDVKARAHRLIGRLEAAGAHVYVPRRDQDYAVVVGLRMLRQRHLVAEEGGLFRARPEEALLLAYYAHSVAHLLPEGAAAVA